MKAKGFIPNAVVVVAILGALSVGCSNMTGQDSELDYTPTILSVNDARAKTRELSSNILDLTEVRGRVTEPGPRVGICEEDPERNRLFKMAHTWSIYGVPRSALEAGMDQLRQQLPKRGWEILEDGVQNNANRSPRILFENREVEYAANVVLSGGPQDDPMLVVSLVSACFSTPKGESPRGEY